MTARLALLGFVLVACSRPPQAEDTDTADADTDLDTDIDTDVDADTDDDTVDTLDVDTSDTVDTQSWATGVPTAHTAHTGLLTGNTGWSATGGTGHTGQVTGATGHTADTASTGGTGCRLLTWYQDVDGDGFGSDVNTITGCLPPLGYVGSGGDCNDLREDLTLADAMDCGNNVGPSVVIDAPVATMREDETLALSGLANDVDGLIVRYQWEQLGGPTLSFSASSAQSTDITAPLSVAAPSVAAVQLTVWDDDGATGSDTVLIMVSPNLAPTADAGPGQVVDEQSLVTLDGSASLDPDGLPLSYNWTVTSNNATLFDAASPTPSFVAPVVLAGATATVSLDLQVTDDRGLQDSASVDIVVQPVNLAPEVTTMPVQQVLAGDSVVLSASAVDFDGSVDPGGWSWQQVGGIPVVFGGGTSDSISFVAPNPGTTTAGLSFRATATDNEDATGSAVFVVRVDPTGSNQPPVLGPIPDISVSSGAAVSLSASCTDSNGDTLSYSWQYISGPLPTDLAPTNGANLDFTAPMITSADTLVLQAQCSDGSVSDSQLVSVVIAATTGNQPPVLTMPADTFAASGSPVSLTASCVDPENEPVSWEWKWKSGPFPTDLVPVNNATVDFTAPNVSAATPLVLEATCFDTSGNSTTGLVTISLQPSTGNQPPIAATSGDLLVPEGTPQTISASSSSDPDFDALSYAWSYFSGPAVVLRDATNVIVSFNTPFVSAGDRLVLQLDVADGKGASDSVLVNVDITDVPIPTPPKLNPIPQQVVHVGDVVNIDAFATDDGVITNYDWSRAWGSNVALTLSGTPPGSRVSFRPTVAESYGFDVIAFDDDLLTDFATAIVDVYPSGDDLPPLAVAGPDQNVPVNTFVTLDGSGSYDPEGFALSYDWRQLTGTSVTLSDSSAMSPTFTTSAVPDVLVFELWVTDVASNSAVRQVKVLSGSNQPPIFDPSPGLNVWEGDAVSLMARVRDPDGSVASISWTQTGGTDVFPTPTSGDTTQFIALGPTPGVLQFTVVATDDLGATSSQLVQVEVFSYGTDLPPVCHAGFPFAVGQGGFVTLDGSFSFDPEGGSLSYAWMQSGPGTGVSLTGASSSQASFVAPSNGAETLTFDLTVTDVSLQSRSCSVQIEVIGGQPPVADAGVDYTLAEGGLLSLNGFSSYDPDGTIASYLWEQVSGPPVFISDGTQPIQDTYAPFVGPAGADLVFKLTVWDADGDMASDTVTVSITDQIFGGAPPIIAPISDQNVHLGDLVTLSGSASDDGTIVSYAWSQPRGTLQSLSTPNASSTQFTASVVEPLTFELLATDNDGMWTTEKANVNVYRLGVNLPPIAVVPQRISGDEGTLITLDGSASYDPDGVIIFQRWSQPWGPFVTLADEFALTTSFVAPVTGRTEFYTFDLLVTDNNDTANANMSSVTVMVGPPQAPWSDPMPDVYVHEGEPVSLYFNAVDPEGRPLTYTWVRDVGRVVVLDPDNQAGTGFIAPWPVMGPGPDLYEFSVTATDDQGLSTVGAVHVEVFPTGVNLPPVANAGLDVVVQEGDPISLDGSASYDAEDGLVNTYAWSQPTGTLVPLTGDTTSWPYGTAPWGTAPEVLTFRLDVTDTSGNSSFDLVDISINAPPLLDPLNPITVAPGDLVTLTANAIDPEGGLLTWDWTQVSNGANVIALGPIDQPTTTFTAPSVTVAEDIVMQVTVRDEWWMQDITQVIVRVDPGVVNDPPVAVVSGGGAWPEQTTVFLDGNSSYDPNGDAISYQWTQTDLLPRVVINFADKAVADFTTPVVLATDPPVFHEFTLRVTDSAGLFSDTILNIQVTPVNAPPLISPLAPLNVIEGDPVVVDWSPLISDSDGTIAQYLWSVVLGTTPVDWVPPNAAQVSFTAPAGGQLLQLRLDVTDNEGATSWNVVDINVAAATANTPPWADPGPDTAMLSTDIGVLDASASGDPDAGDTIVAWHWKQTQGSLFATIANDVAKTTTFTLPAALSAPSESYAFELVVQDSRGAWSVAATHFVSITEQAGPVLTMGTVLDFEGNDGGLADPTGLWQYGSPTMGPAFPHSGTGTWGTRLGADYWPAADASLDFVVDLRSYNSTGAAVGFWLWCDAAANDGVALEVYDVFSGGWVRAPIDFGLPDGADTIGPVWSQCSSPGGGYTYHAATLESWLGGYLRARLRFTSDSTTQSAGIFLDDLMVADDSTDLDNDGIFGILQEVYSGGDPLRADTDGDTVWDGDELSAGTGLGNPADYPAAPLLVTGAPRDLDLLNGLVAGTIDPATLGNVPNLWGFGVPTSGPNRAYNGSNVWATNLGGPYPIGVDAALYLPPLDVGTLPNPVLTFRLWGQTASNSGLHLEVWDGLAWVNAGPALFPPYDGNDPLANQSWASHGYQSAYVLAAIDLSGWTWLGSRLQTRLRFTAGSTGAPGFYLDEFGLYDEGSDPDGDRFVGIAAEYSTAGTDPLRFDTDGDGEGDYDESLAGAMANNPADYSTAPVLSGGSRLFLDADDGGLVSGGVTPELAQTGGLWAWGQPTVGPGAGYNGLTAWGTNLAGDYFADAEEALYLPSLDLSGMASPTFALRVWTKAADLSSDGLALEVYNGAQWVNVPVISTGYDGSDPMGNPVWHSQHYGTSYLLAMADLSLWKGGLVPARLMFRSDASLQDVGAYVDEIALFDESADPDSDGLLGVISEWTTYGTDPFNADTDGDTLDDGAEVSFLVYPLDPLDPSDAPSGTPWSPPWFENFDTSDGGLMPAPVVGVGLAQSQGVWGWGIPNSGPNQAHSGSQVWATELAGEVPLGVEEYLHLPPLELTASANPTLAMRIWVDGGGPNSGLSLQVNSGAGWNPLASDTIPYEGLDGFGNPAWNQQQVVNGYLWMGASLAPYAGQRVRVRLAYRNDPLAFGAGAYIDDVALYEESDDPDSDGVFGLLTEWGGGSDPFLFDTDGDGVDDKTEVLAVPWSDPMDPAWTPSTGTLLPGSLLDFEADNGGLAQWPVAPVSLAPLRSVWAWGAPSGGPGVAFSGSNVWAPSLAGDAPGDGRFEFLSLPRIDLSAATAPVLYFRLWAGLGANEVLTLEVEDPTLGWQPLVPAAPAYDGASVDGVAGWNTLQNTLPPSPYRFVAADLSPWASQVIRVRFVVLSAESWKTGGVFIDDLGVIEDGEYDGDSLNGVLNEIVNYGTDPFDADTDDDGVNDGIEVGAGTDPLDPLSK